MIRDPKRLREEESHTEAFINTIYKVQQRALNDRKEKAGKRITLIPKRRFQKRVVSWKLRADRSRNQKGKEPMPEGEVPHEVHYLRISEGPHQCKEGREKTTSPVANVAGKNTECPSEAIMPNARVGVAHPTLLCPSTHTSPSR